MLRFSSFQTATDNRSHLRKQGQREARQKIGVPVEKSVPESELFNSIGIFRQ
jgi:hypothetical protein